MNLKHITDVFFDLDHTLWDFEKNSAVAFHKIFSNHQMLFAFDDFLMVYPEINKNYWKLYESDLITNDHLRSYRLKDSFEQIKIKISDEQINAIAIEYIELLPESNFLINGTIQALDYLAKKYNLHLLTNGMHHIQQRKLQNAKIAQYFKTITDSGSVGYKKPNPIIFNFALQQANCQAENAVMIGDNLDADIKGALHVGMNAILLDESKKIIDEEINIINTLDELKKYL